MCDRSNTKVPAAICSRPRLGAISERPGGWRLPDLLSSASYQGIPGWILWASGSGARFGSDYTLPTQPAKLTASDMDTVARGDTAAGEVGLGYVQHLITATPDAFDDAAATQHHGVGTPLNGSPHPRVHRDAMVYRRQP